MTRFTIPDQFDAWCDAHARALTENAGAADFATGPATAEHVVREAEWATDVVIRQECAETVFAWLRFLHAGGAAQRLVTAGVEDLEVWGPFTETGRATGHHSGARWYLLDPVGKPALVQIHRRGPAWGDTRPLRDVETFAATVPTAICRRMAEDIRTDTVWLLVRDALRRNSGVPS